MILNLNFKQLNKIYLNMLIKIYIVKLQNQ